MWRHPGMSHGSIMTTTGSPCPCWNMCQWKYDSTRSRKPLASLNSFLFFFYCSLELTSKVRSSDIGQQWRGRLSSGLDRKYNSKSTLCRQLIYLLVQYSDQNRAVQRNYWLTDITAYYNTKWGYQSARAWHSIQTINWQHSLTQERKRLIADSSLGEMILSLCPQNIISIYEDLNQQSWTLLCQHPTTLNCPWST